jgi:hypothetical protein
MTLQCTKSVYVSGTDTNRSWDLGLLQCCTSSHTRIGLIPLVSQHRKNKSRISVLRISSVYGHLPHVEVNQDGA